MSQLSDEDARRLLAARKALDEVEGQLVQARQAMALPAIQKVRPVGNGAQFGRTVDSFGGHSPYRGAFTTQALEGARTFLAKELTEAEALQLANGPAIESNRVLLEAFPPLHGQPGLLERWLLPE